MLGLDGRRDPDEGKLGHLGILDGRHTAIKMVARPPKARMNAFM